jgi:hypothetical protein
MTLANFQIDGKSSVSQMSLDLKELGVPIPEDV